MHAVMRLALVVSALLVSSALAEEKDRHNHGHNQSIVRDSQGYRRGTVERNERGDYVVRDSQGYRTGTVEKDSRGDYVTRDSQGYRTGTIERRR